MPEDALTTTSDPRRARRFLISVGTGSAIAAAVVATIAPIAAWMIRSPSDFPVPTQTRMSVAAVTTGIGVLLLLACRFRGRKPLWSIVVTLIGLLTAGLAAWGAWVVIELYRNRSALPFVDTTGATVISGIAIAAGVAAALFGLATVAFISETSKRTAACAFLIVAIAVALLTYQSVEHRDEVWQPDLTTAASPPAPVPDSIGDVQYEVTIGHGNGSDIYAAGNGFVVDTRKGLTAYDGPTGKVRWHAGDFGTSGRLLVVRRDRDDAAGIVVLQLYYGLIAFDGSSGEVLWRRQYSGDLTAAAGSVDALGIVVFSADAKDERTQLHSIDPATGQLRWSKPISCSNPTFLAGTPGQFSLDCWTPSIIDARTGAVIDTPGKHAPRAGSDAYVTSVNRGDGPAQTEVTLVLDPNGKTIDEISGVHPVSRADNGFLLMYADSEGWLLRDYRKRRSIPVRIDIGPRPRSGSYEVETRYWLDNSVETAWLDSRLVVVDTAGAPRRLQLVDPARPNADAVSAELPCARGESMQDLEAVAGAVIVRCNSDGDAVVGLVPQRR